MVEILLGPDEGSPKFHAHDEILLEEESVNVVALLRHILGAPNAATGFAKTVTGISAVFVHPFASVTVRVYVVLVVGETIITFVVPLTGLHE